MVLETFATHFGVKGINKDLLTLSAGLLVVKRPIGAMGLACAAVCYPAAHVT